MSIESDLFRLDGQVAIVTGGAGVIPGAMAVTLLRAGASVALWGRGTNHPVADAAEDLRKQADVSAERVAAITVDTGKEDAVEEALDQTIARLDMPSILVNGVGGNNTKSDFIDIDIKSFGDVLQLNLLAGLVIPTKVTARRWIHTQHPGSIINLASMASYRALSGVWAYDAAKAGVLNLTEAAAKEFAPHGIRVNGIAPGFFVGHQNRRLLIKDDSTGELTERGRSIIDRTPFGRFGRLDDLPGVTLFLASSKASTFVTGVTIPVDGGYGVNSI
jgi:NAD(P)-dependent dehydrogenase (short-subunit alcohol dehydrogenase family)